MQYNDPNIIFSISIIIQTANTDENMRYILKTPQNSHNVF